MQAEQYFLRRTCRQNGRIPFRFRRWRELHIHFPVFPQQIRNHGFGFERKKAGTDKVNCRAAAREGGLDHMEFSLLRKWNGVSIF
ncbi:MAG: hypothetical protein HPZ79_00675 [Oscillospiraceae bacterium]|nr:hypothetical protein [Oscillospiraceae bacterium]